MAYIRIDTSANEWVNTSAIRSFHSWIYGLDINGARERQANDPNQEHPKNPHYVVMELTDGSRYELSAHKDSVAAEERIKVLLSRISELKGGDLLYAEGRLLQFQRTEAAVSLSD